MPFKWLKEWLYWSVMVLLSPYLFSKKENHEIISKVWCCMSWLTIIGWCVLTDVSPEFHSHSVKWVCSKGCIMRMPKTLFNLCVGWAAPWKWIARHIGSQRLTAKRQSWALAAAADTYEVHPYFSLIVKMTVGLWLKKEESLGRGRGIDNVGER